MPKGSGSLEALLAAVDTPVSHLRSNEIHTNFWSAIPEQYSHWIEEQRAARESCIFADQSFHMADLYIRGPAALDLLSDLTPVNMAKFVDNDPPQAKHYFVANPDGYLIGDSILFSLDSETFLNVGHFNIQNWIQYHLDTGEYQANGYLADDPISEGPVTAGRRYPSHDGPPKDFRFEIQGPAALRILSKVADTELPELSFFDMGEFSINGVDIRALAHGMSGAPGWEIFGPFEYHREIKETIFEAGDAYELTHVGRRSYLSGAVRSGWFPVPVPAIYDHDELADYREWLGDEDYESMLSIGGSYRSEEITDYYLDPIENGFEPLIDFDRDFIGRDSLLKRAENPKRTKVTFVWDSGDVLDVFGSLFEADATQKLIELPTGNNTKWEAHFDEVKHEGEPIGVSKWHAYDYNEREYLSIGLVDLEYSEPGTRVSIVWGDDDTWKSHIERHEKVEIGARVAHVPYIDAGKKDM